MCFWLRTWPSLANFQQAVHQYICCSGFHSKMLWSSPQLAGMGGGPKFTAAEGAGAGVGTGADVQAGV